jgi:N6-adenosine-specific RNA methylase IME4
MTPQKESKLIKERHRIVNDTIAVGRWVSPSCLLARGLPIRWPRDVDREARLKAKIRGAEGRGMDVGELLRAEVSGQFGTILADPPWRFQNRTGKMAPEHRRLRRYGTMSLHEIAALPVESFAAQRSHLYLWVPNALLGWGLEVMRAWGFTYKANLVWYKIRADGGPDGRGVGFYFRNVTELVLFGVRGNLRTRQAGRRQVNLIATRKREHSRKPDQLYPIIEECSPGPYLELFARHRRKGWEQWGDEIEEDEPSLAFAAK